MRLQNRYNGSVSNEATEIDTMVE